MTFDSTRQSMITPKCVVNVSRAQHRHSMRFGESQFTPNHFTLGQKKRFAAVGLAAAMAAPQWLMQFSGLSAARGATTQPSNDSSALPSTSVGLLKQATDQFTAGQFLQASATLEKVDPKTLSESDHTAFIQLYNRANHATTEQLNAREDLMLGRDALSSGHISEAQTHFKAIVANAHADDATKKDAAEQLALMGDSGAKSAAVADAVPASPAVQATQSPTGPSSAGSSSQDGAIAYNRARAEYRSGDMTAARQDFVLARNMGYAPGLMEGLSPQEYLTRMDEKAKADAQALAQNTSGVRTASGSFNGSSQTVNLAQSADQTVQSVTAQQKAAAAKDLVTKAAAAEANKDMSGAMSLYQQAVDADPSNADAVAGRDRTRAALGLTPVGAGNSALAGTATQIGLEHDAIQTRFNLAVDNANKALAAQDYNTAQDQIASATAIMQEDPNVFSAPELGGMSATIASLNSQLHGGQEAQQTQDQLKAITSSQEANAARMQAEEENRQHAIESLIKVARTYQEQKDYAGMLGVLDQILALQPTNDYAVQMRPNIEEQAYTQEQKMWRQRFDTQYMRQIVTSEEMQVPYADQVVYPDNWPEISELRDSETQNSDLSKADQQVQLQLSRELPKVQFDATALSEIIGGSGGANSRGFLSDVTGANIIVNWQALQTQNVDKTTPITLSLSNVPFRKVLQLVLDQAAGGSKKLGYTVSDGIIEISSDDDLSSAVITKVYDIRDLLINPNFMPQASGIAAPALTGGSATGGGGGTAGSTSVNVTTTVNQTVEQTLQLIETHIMNEVAPDTWKSTGTGQGYIDDWNQSLIITQTPEVQQQVQDLLEKLRATEAVQVTVECRFLVVDRDFMNDVNVNLQVGYLPPPTSAWYNGGAGISLINASYGFTQFPTTGVPGSIGSNALGETFNTGYITNDWTITLLIRATQAERHESVVQAPRVTLESGQTALIEDYTSTPYVSSLTGLVGTGASTITPVISYATNGVGLSVEGAWVSADRKYVTLDLEPILEQLLGFSTFTFQSSGVTSSAAATSTGTTVGTTGLTVIEVAPPATLSIQEPSEATTTVSTRVIIPDGGTLLMGGVTIAGELHLEAGVPGLSKIPLLKRLVTNSSDAKDEEVVLVLVKPTILINKEVEAKQFPLLTSSAK